MGKRYDYRNDYKGWNSVKIIDHLGKLKIDLLDNIGICQSRVDDLMKRITYLENKYFI